MPSFRAAYTTKGVHNGGQVGGSLPSSTTDTDIYVPRRMAHSSNLATAGARRHLQGDGDNQGFSVYHQYPKVAFHSTSDNVVLKGLTRLTECSSHVFGGNNPQFDSVRSMLTSRSLGIRNGLIKGSRPCSKHVGF
jgi:hypothetical protein